MTSHLSFKHIRILTPDEMHLFSGTQYIYNYLANKVEVVVRSSSGRIESEIRKWIDENILDLTCISRVYHDSDTMRMTLYFQTVNSREYFQEWLKNTYGDGDFDA